MKFDIVTRLRNPPFGTETSERNIMDAAADEIERLRAALSTIADGKRDADQSYATLFAEVVREARAALPKG